MSSLGWGKMSELRGEQCLKMQPHCTDTNLLWFFYLDEIIRSIFWCFWASSSISGFFRFVLLNFFLSRSVQFPWKSDFHLGQKFIFPVSSTELMNLEFVLYFIFQCGQSSASPNTVCFVLSSFLTFNFLPLCMLFTFHILEIALDANTSISDSTLKILEVTRKFKVKYDRSELLLLIHIIGFRDFGFFIFFFY